MEASSEIKTFAVGYREAPHRGALHAANLYEPFRDMIESAALPRTVSEREQYLFDLTRLSYLAAMKVAVTKTTDKDVSEFSHDLQLVKVIINQLSEESSPEFKGFLLSQIAEGEALIGKNYPLGMDTEGNNPERQELYSHLLAGSFENPIWELQRRYVLYNKAIGRGFEESAHYPFQSAKSITQDETNRSEHPLEMAFYEAFVDVETARDAFIASRYQNDEARRQQRWEEYTGLINKLKESQPDLAAHPILIAWIETAEQRALADRDGMNLKF